MKKITFILALAFLSLSVNPVFGQIQSPEDYLGFKVGTDRKLADMSQIIAYFKLLDEASERIIVHEVGKTTMGNPFIYAIITSAANHQSLEHFRMIQQRLADPRKISDSEAEAMIAEGKAVVMINCSIHATEIGASQMSMQLAYDLASRSDRKFKQILDNVILLLTPMHNPDGIQMVVEWYNQNLGTKYEGGRMPWLYHKYVGHDNNRDWFMLTQKETQMTIKIHNAWHPHVIVDMHQMGSSGARLFVPPFVDPYEPNIDPILRQQVAMMGTFIAAELTAEGKAGVMHSTGFDAWTPARAYHHYHGGIRILTEAASVRVATPINIPFDQLRPNVKTESVKMPLPWKGGQWKLSDIIAYDYSAAIAALTNAASLRGNWVRNYYRIFRNEVNRASPPFAYVIPQQQKDLATAVKMLNVLKMGGVEVHKARQKFDADGHEYPAGTYLVYLAQPFGGFAKTLLERQVYPEIRETPGGPLKTPYDVVGHTLPLLMGVEAVKIDNSFTVDSKLLVQIKKPRGQIKTAGTSAGFIWGHSSNDDIVALNRLLKKDYHITWLAEDFSANGKSYPRGSMLVRNHSNLESELQKITEDLHVLFESIKTLPEVPAYKIKFPRLGVYKSWTGSMDEGWTRFVLEQFEFSFQSLSNQDIRKGNLEQGLDVILFPDMGNQTIINGLSDKDIPAKYAGGIGEVGIKNIKTFIQNGGALITLNSASEFGLKSLGLNVENRAAGLERTEFFIPGSLLQVINNMAHPIAYGYNRDTAIFFRRSPVFAPAEGVSVATYPVHSLLSGWATGEEYLVNRSAIVDVPFEKGRIILIGFPAQYRSQSHGSFRYLFNAIFYGAASPEGI